MGPRLSTSAPSPLQLLGTSNGSPLWHASGVQGSEIYHVKGEELHLKAFCLGEIESLGTRSTDWSNGDLRRLSDLNLDNGDDYPMTGQNRMEALWRTMTCDNDQDGSSAAASMGFAFQTALKVTMGRGVKLALDRGESRSQYFKTIRPVLALAQDTSISSFPGEHDLLEWCEICGFHEGWLEILSDHPPEELQAIQDKHPFGMQSDSPTHRGRLFAMHSGLLGITADTVRT